MWAYLFMMSLNKLLEHEFRYIDPALDNTQDFFLVTLLELTLSILFCQLLFVKEYIASHEESTFVILS